MGHTEKGTTENYLGNFIPEIKKEFETQLVDLVRQMGDKLVTKGLKQIALEDMNEDNKTR